MSEPTNTVTQTTPNAEELLEFFAPFDTSPAELLELIAPWSATRDTSVVEAQLRHLAADEAHIDSLSAPELDAELRAQGIAIEALRTRLATLIESEPVRRESLGRGLERLWQGLVSYLTVSQVGLERLERAFAPAVLDGERDLALTTALAEEVVLPLYVGGDDAAVMISLLWRHQPPAEPPAVRVAVSGTVLDVTVTWQDWPSMAGCTAGLVLDDLGLAASVFATTDTVLACAWDDAEQRLLLDLLPVTGEPDDQ